MNKDKMKEMLVKAIVGQSGKCDDLGNAVDNSLQILPHNFLKDTAYDKVQKFEVPDGKDSQKIKTSAGKFGAIEANWVDEGAVIPAAKEQFYAKTLKLGKLAVMVPTTGEITDDVSYLQTFLRTKLPKAISYAINKAIVYGSDVVNASVKGIVADAKQLTYFAPSTDFTVAIPDMFSKVAHSDDNMWFFGKAAWQKLIENTFSFIKWDGKDAYIFGQSAKCVNWLNSDDVIYGDFGYYAISQKPLQQEVSEHIYFDSNQNALKTIMRMAGEVPYVGPFTSKDTEIVSDSFVDDELEIASLSSVNLYTMTFNASSAEEELKFIYGGDDTFYADNCNYTAEVFGDIITLNDEYATVNKTLWNINSYNLDTQLPPSGFVEVAYNMPFGGAYFTPADVGVGLYWNQELYTSEVSVAEPTYISPFYTISGDAGPFVVKVRARKADNDIFTKTYEFTRPELIAGDWVVRQANIDNQLVAVAASWEDDNNISVSGFSFSNPLDNPNGDYSVFEYNNNKPLYVSELDGVPRIIRWNTSNSVWEMHVGVQPDVVFSSTDDVPTPDQVTTWVDLADGDTPGIVTSEPSDVTRFIISYDASIAQIESIEWQKIDIDTVNWSEYTTIASWTAETNVSEYGFAALSGMEIG